MRIQAFCCLGSIPRPPVASRQQRLYACVAAPRSQVSGDLAADQLLNVVAKKANVSGLQVAQLYELGKLVLSANKTTNLTAVRSHDGLVARHLVDGLGLLPTLDALQSRTEKLSLVDVGSGAGFPGLILALCRPAWQITLVDSVRKKCKFHEQAIGELGLQNAESLWGRAEDLGRDPLHREHFDVACARAVAHMPVLAELTLPLVRTGGALVAQKSIEKTEPYVELDAARRALEILGGCVETIEYSWTCDLVRSYMPLEADNVDDTRQRAFVTVRKHSKTANKYPREPGTPKKNPL